MLPIIVLRQKIGIGRSQEKKYIYKKTEIGISQENCNRWISKNVFLLLVKCVLLYNQDALQTPIYANTDNCASNLMYTIYSPYRHLYAQVKGVILIHTHIYTQSCL